MVLTYRNTKDLLNFISVTNKRVQFSYKIVVVNSFYDEESRNDFYQIAKKNNCDFLNVDNKGYGYGNNRGINFAKEKYTFDFLIVSNPDIEIINFPIESLIGLEDCLIAPSIKTLTGKKQNPFYYSNIKLVDFLKYYSCLKRSKIYAYVGIIINKIYRETGLLFDTLFKRKRRKIFAAHGSFIVFGFKALNKLKTVYNEQMFLFHEENHLAKLAHSKKIDTYMVPEIKVLHKEDGSVGLESEKMSKYGRESFIIYYESWEKNKGI